MHVLTRLPRTICLALVLALPGQALPAQILDVPFVIDGGDGEAAWCASSVVAGLDPNGDGFLAVRTGPGTQYRMIDQLHNGDVVETCDGSGPWVAVVYGPRQRVGWVHRNWLRDLAG